MNELRMNFQNFPSNFLQNDLMTKMSFISLIANKENVLLRDWLLFPKNIKT